MSLSTLNFQPGTVLPTLNSAFRVTQGTIQRYGTQSESGGHNLGGFCPKCGSRLTGAESPDEGIIGVLASSLDDPAIFNAALEIYTADAQPWDFMDSTTAKHPHGFPR